MRFASKRLIAALAGVAALVPATGIVVASVNAPDHGRDRRCARAFDEAQRTDMESFRDFDAEAFRAVHDEDAVSIFPSGAMFSGIDDIMAALEGHFRDKNAVWSWTELSRHIDGCRTGVIIYDATYDIPAIGFHQRALTAVTYTFEHGRWLAVLDQGTLLE
jgi:hypothetical protein